MKSFTKWVWAGLIGLALTGSVMAGVPIRNQFLVGASTSPTVTWSGTTTGGPSISPLWYQETIGGTSTASSGGQLSGNLFAATDNLSAPAPIYAWSLMDLADNVGASAQGARNVLKAFAEVQTPPNVPGTPGGNYPAYVGVFPGGNIGVNLGGTGTTLATSAGSLYGINPNVTLGASATNIFGVTGGEFDMTMLAGSSAAQKFGLDIVQANTDAVQGSVDDAAIGVFNQPGAVGWKCGICFGGNGSGGAFPIASGGTLLGTIGTGGMALTTGIDLTQITVSGNAFQSNNFSVSGSGAITGVNFGWYGHLIPTTGVTPNVPTFSCGSGCTASGSDSDGRLIPSSAVSAGTVTFSAAWAANPYCTATGQSTSNGVITVTAVSTHAVTFSMYNGGVLADFSGTDGFTYHCMD